MSENNDAAPGRQAKRGPAVDLKGMTAAQLRQLIADAEAELKGKQEAAKAELRAKWEAEAAEAGLSIQAVLPLSGGRSGDGKRASRKEGSGDKLPVKFKGPNGEEWSGRGRLPKWLQTMEAEGRKREEFKV